ncbi:MAG: amylo-alpha-1,6-glucosidase [Kiritimatiellia bacterium]|nr:amylo-alpha-1,6-glucosidase [Kiritimatiellia bacterium]
MEQIPHPGQHILAFCGDTLEFVLRVPGDRPGRAWLRTNIGHADTARLAIIAETTLRQKRLAEDWFDIPMTAGDQGSAGASNETYRLALPLTEVGHFEAKAFFLPEGAKVPLWPPGDNTSINVHPAEYCCDNSLYNAFVRLFGQERRPEPSCKDYAQYKKCQLLEDLGFAVIPPSGTFRDLIRQLDFIVGRLKCRMIMLLPIHPTPTVYGRMGEFGSPYAALDFMDVDPALAEFDRKATPLEQFSELVDAVHARGAKLFMDIAINHTGWAAKIHSMHPEWLVRDKDGSIRSPGAWGTTWADLTELDYKRPELWNYLAEVFLAWCRRGVDGFRCDAGYMIPVSAWEFIVASVRREFPNTIFLLEGLGGSLEATKSLLNISNLNWAYSELFQNYDRAQIENYLSFAFQVSESDGLLIHFAETHDNSRLAARSPVYAKMRTALSALCSSNGAFAFTSGVEWLATEKIDVHKRTSLNWDNPVNQLDHIARLNCILGVHPAFFNGAHLKLIHHDGGSDIIAFLRHHPPSGKKLLVLVNLNEKAAQPVSWSTDDARFSSGRLTDLLTGREVAVTEKENTIKLAPGEALCLTPDADDMRLILSGKKQPLADYSQLWRQQLRAKALEAFISINHIGDVSAIDPDKIADELADDPRAFCRNLNRRQAEEGVVIWDWPNDVQREVMIPPSYFLLVRAPAPFRAQLREGRNVLNQQDAIRQTDGNYFALFMPRPPPADFLACILDLSVYHAKGVINAPEGAKHATGHILYLPEPGKTRVKRIFLRNELPASNPIFLGTNGRGGMMRAAVKWGEIRSKYDALLAGNLNPQHPEDRRVMLTRCRVWLVYHGYSQDVTIDRLEQFDVGPGHARWHFRVPFGYGKLVFIEVDGAMAYSAVVKPLATKAGLPGLNAIRLSFRRLSAASHGHCLSDSESVRVIIRPDIEDRNFHEDTKAFLGPETSFPQSIRPQTDGFTFAPDASRQLKVNIPRSEFRVEPEWQYMIHHPVEAERGLNATSDLFSPGYFQSELKGGDEITLSARIVTPQEKDEPDIFSLPSKPAAHLPAEENILSVLESALKQFIVKREDLKTVIAGYPWFLDWGRDTLIFCRGMIAAGLTDEVFSIIRQFASYEEGGTLPNMIIGDNASNRDCSDAPLWLFTACADLTRSLGKSDWLNEKCGRRPLLEVLRSIASAYRKGTANGIACDSESGLIFSPAHFTWMDTNFPAGTPREGYPIEIQALWFAALKFLAEITGEKQWDDFARLVQESVLKLYWRGEQGFLADCLHAPRGRPAAKAKADDALRPNQLLALTLGTVSDEKIFAETLSSCAELLVPGAIRTLANRRVDYPLPIERDGKLINDPKNPYWGRYEGDEDSRRKPAYHNGTAWTWMFPSFCEAWFKHYGKAGRPTALAILNSSLRLINRGCLGQIPEICDGDYPHVLRGCDAQAWGVSELYRVWKLLEDK